MFSIYFIVYKHFQEHIQKTGNPGHKPQQYRATQNETMTLYNIDLNLSITGLDSTENNLEIKKL